MDGKRIVFLWLLLREARSAPNARLHPTRSAIAPRAGYAQAVRRYSPQAEGGFADAKETVPGRPIGKHLTRKGTVKARKFKQATILLKANESLSDPQIMAAVNVSRPTVDRPRKRFVEGGLGKSLSEVPPLGKRRKLDGLANLC